MFCRLLNRPERESSQEYIANLAVDTSDVNTEANMAATAQTLVMILLVVAPLQQQTQAFPTGEGLELF